MALDLDDDDVAEWAELGVTVETDDDPASLTVPPTDVWSVNWAAVQVFLDLETQWRPPIVGPGGLIWLGLDYGEVERMIRLHGADPTVFWDIKVMEAAALPVLNTREGGDA